LRKKTIYDEHSTTAQYLVIVVSMPVARWHRPCEAIEMASERQADVALNLAVFFDGSRGTSEGLTRIVFGAAMALISTAEQDGEGPEYMCRDVYEF
jgi:hypothetical protein